MSAPWFHVDDLPGPGGSWPLSRDEAKHATGAKRLGPGDDVVLFDGSGRVAHGTLGGERGRDGSLPVLVHDVNVVERVGRRIHLACALPKGDRLSTMVDMTTQLGAASLTPLRCERSVVGETDARAERIRRIQVEACKQARCPWVPAFHHETDVPSLARLGAANGRRSSSVASRPEAPGDGEPRPSSSLVVLHPAGRPLQALVPSLGADVTVAIGPEGGFTDAEVDLLVAAGALSLSVGATILRIETAAVVATALLRG